MTVIREMTVISMMFCGLFAALVMMMVVFIVMTAAANPGHTLK